MGLALKALTIAFPGMGVPGLLLSMAAGAAIFIASCYAFDVREIKDSWAWISARR
jgi:hypothetical protein